MRMKLNGLDISDSDIERYLYDEMEQPERDAFDEQIFSSNDLFFAVADLEDLLVDGFVARRLSPGEMMRFEQSLKYIPSRRDKVANAVALRAFIKEDLVVSGTGVTIWDAES